MALSYNQKKRADVYKKHYTVLPLQIRNIGADWEVYYVIRSMEAVRPLYMRLASCNSKQLAAVKLDEIEDYIYENF